MKPRILLTILAVTWLMTVAAGAGGEKEGPGFMLEGSKIEMYRYARVYTGEGNVKIEVARYKSGNGDGAILLFHGIEGPWDTRAVKHSVRDIGYGNENYVADYGGNDWVTIAVRSQPGGVKAYYCAVPGVKDDLRVFPSDKLSQGIDPGRIFAEYLRQQEKKGESIQ